MRIRVPSDRRRLLHRVKTLAAAFVVATFITWIGRAFLRVAVQHRASSVYFAGVVWGALVLASFAGWGCTVNAVAFPKKRADWGLRTAWGWGVAVALGGLLCSLAWAKSAALVALVALGLVQLVVGVARGYRRWSQRPGWRAERLALAEAPFAIGVAAIGALGIAQYMASIHPFGQNGNDDNLCYFAFVREILERGTLTQSFSFRRASVYGAQSLLDAIQLAIPVPVGHARAIDGGLAPLTVMALILGHVRSSRWTARAIVLLLSLLVLTMPDIRINSAATMTGVVFFLGLYRTLAWSPFQRASGWRAALPVAVLAAGACGLRQNYLVPIAVLLLLYYGVPAARGIRLRPIHVWSPRLRDALIAALLLVLCLVPWWAMSQRACHTFLFPIVRGDFNRDYPFFVPVTGFEQLHYIWLNVSHCLPVKAVPLFLVAALTLRNRSRPDVLGYFVFAAFVGFAVLLKSVPDSDADNIGRYYFGFTCAALVAIGLAVADLSARGGGNARIRAARAAAVPLILSGIAVQIYGDRAETAKDYDGYLTSIQHDYENPTPWDVPPVPDVTYATLQDAVPAGAPVVVMVDDPYRFDFARNRIESLDIVGAVSPKPGIPLFAGAEEVAQYLVSLGYNYAIVVHPDAAASLYRRSTWVDKQANGAPIWKRTAPFYLAAFDVFDQLRATHVHYVDMSSMTTLDLRRRAP